ncbi:beta-glucosidase, putative [Rhizoctonia solani AG-1 IA]|uniref:Beta-glucosidase, putative n=1 Tax=Thanatephorus cucumeris (strain AG1-IA) TaxID=983506 RepID=L8X4C6_THACA|nr:beta-glucosidase, putative [Rhizoctonia solani AG-1 IA]
MKTVAWTGFLVAASAPVALAQGSSSTSTSHSFSTTRTTTSTTTQTSTSTSTSSPSGRPLYKNPNAPIEDRIKDLLPRMTVEDKVAQLIQGDINGWMDMNDPKDNTLTLKLVYAVTVGQKYLMENTTLGIPAIFQSEGLHGFTNNGTIFPSPLSMACSFNNDLIRKVAEVVSNEAEPLGITQIFAPVLDLGRELRWGRVEESFGEDHFINGEMGLAFVEGIQSGRRLNASTTAIARMAATCKHFAAFGTPHGGLNIAPVAGGERDLRSVYLRPFNRACLNALSIMTAYSSYDGIPAVTNKQWGYKYWAVSAAANQAILKVDLPMTLHGTCDSRECCAKKALENGLQGEMGGGTYTYLTLPEQIRAGKVSQTALDETVTYMLRTKFALGLFENPYPYANYTGHVRTKETLDLLLQVERESIVLLENHNNILPLSKTSIKSVALIGPSLGTQLGDYVFAGAKDNAVSRAFILPHLLVISLTTPTIALDGFKKVLAGSNVQINYAEGCKLWSASEEGFPEAVAAAQKSDVAVVAVGTWSLDQTLLWQGVNATTGEHVDVSDLGLVGAQLNLIKAIKATGKKVIVVYVSGKPIAETWVYRNADAIISQFYGGELQGVALAEVIFGDYNPSGRTSASWPRSVGTAPAFYDYLKGARPVDWTGPGRIEDDGTLVFGHEYSLDTPVPFWSFGHGLSYTTFQYSGLKLNKSVLSATDTLVVTVNVKNTGSRAVSHLTRSPQVYMTDVVSSVVTPVQSLQGYTKIDLQPGQSKSVSISIPVQNLAVWTLENKFVVEPGKFTVQIGTSQTVHINGTVTVQ